MKIKLELILYMIGFLFVLAFAATSSVQASELEKQPALDCNSGDANLENICMKENWRPKRQVSYDKGTYICDFNGKHLRGTGFVHVDVDDEAYNIEINCPEPKP